MSVYAQKSSSPSQQLFLFTVLQYWVSWALVPNPRGGIVKNFGEHRPVSKPSSGASSHFTAASHSTATMLPSQHVPCQVSTFYGPSTLCTVLHSWEFGPQASTPLVSSAVFGSLGPMLMCMPANSIELVWQLKP